MPDKIHVHPRGASGPSQAIQESSRKEQSNLSAGSEASSPSAALIHPGAGQILQLQALVGNQAVRRILASPPGLSSIQREGEEADASPLSPGQVTTALSFYRSQPRLYTAPIISQIKAALGQAPGEAMTEEDVQAVARWQKKLNETEKPSLKVDGMAGPRTLPTLFRTGLADQGAISNYSGKAQALLEKWAELGTAEARINKLIELVNAELTVANVPNCSPKISDAEGNLGQFDFTIWALDIGKPAFEKADPTPAEKADMADTVYHESRHAEQWYRMAQLQASQGKSAQRIADDMSIPKKIADLAAANPLKKGSMEALIATGWNESVYGAKADHRDKVLTELSAAGKAREKAQENFDKDPTHANQTKLDAATARNEKAVAAYYDLPEENDANRIGARVTTAFMAAEPATEEEAP